jgi:REP element-mobilizing transposase RayT
LTRLYRELGNEPYVVLRDEKRVDNVDSSVSGNLGVYGIELRRLEPDIILGNYERIDNINCTVIVRIADRRKCDNLLKETQTDQHDPEQKKPFSQCAAKIRGVYIGMRKPRKLLDGAVYHVIARVNRRELILNSVEIKDLFLAVVKQAKKRYRFLVKNFCIMGNHVHIMMQPHAAECLSKIMQWILSVFAKSFNRRFKLMGHVWYDRFKSHILHSLRRFLETFVYIAENPVKAGIVSRIDEFAWSGNVHMKRGLRDIVEPPDIICKLFLSTVALPYLLSA